MWFFGSKQMAEIKLGDIARDKVSGFEGVVIGITQWLHGCERLIIQPQKLHDGKPIDALSFDLPQVELVAGKDHVPQTKTGGPRPTPTRH